MITKFKNLFEYYETYKNEDYIMNELNHDLLRNISYVIIEGLREKGRNYKGPGRLSLDGSLKSLCDIVSEFNNTEKTKNWGWDYLINDFEEEFLNFYTKPFYKFMDAISKIALDFFRGSIIDSLNEAFKENSFGYRIQLDRDKPWICINPGHGMVIEIEDVVQSVEELCKQASDHIRQAREQLSKSVNSRARKDGIRDCLSAMEALVKKVTNTSDIDKAIEEMRKNEVLWGPKIITTDGVKLWNLFHREYRDIRHGDDDISEITIEQSIYFVERILAYVNYISKITKNIPQEENIK